jgi:hypothetical protein
MKRLPSPVPFDFAGGEKWRSLFALEKLEALLDIHGP